MNGGAKSILPLPTRAIGTLQDMGGTMRISPLCHEGPHHEINGWVLELPGTGHASTIPVPHNLFHGVSVALCDISEEDILGLMKDGDGTRARLGDAVNTLLQYSKDDASRASWKRCRPQTTTLQSAHRDKDGVITFAPAGPAIIDGAQWECELSPDGFVGIYFRWQSATVQLYAVCQSYLPKACLEFSTLVHHAVDDPDCTAEMVCLSEEAQWLRAACERNRARIIASVCKSIGVSVPVIRDYRSPLGGDLAVVTTDTLHHEITAQNGIVRVFNYCADTSTAHNGSICTMAPWDGVWAFCGPSPSGGFGMLHGKKGVVLPTAAPRVKQREPRHLSFTSFNTRQCKPLQIWHRGSSGAKAIVLPPIVHKHREVTKGDDPLMVESYNRVLQQYTVPMTIPVKRVLDGQDNAQDIYLDFDEHVLEQMARLGWNRSHGNAKLVPLACALYDHWHSQ